MINSMARSLITSKKYYRSMLSGNSAFEPGSFQLLETALVSSTVASVTFNTSTYAAMGYKHLQLRIVGRTTEANGYSGIWLRFNSDSAANYSTHNLYTYNGGFYSGNEINGFNGFVGWIAGGNSGTNIYTPAVIDIIDAFSTTKNKTNRSISGLSSSSLLGITSSSWRSTNPITSILFSSASGSIVAGSRLSLYGIKG